jgi:hypothetical protein
VCPDVPKAETTKVLKVTANASGFYTLTQKSITDQHDIIRITIQFSATHNHAQLPPSKNKFMMWPGIWLCTK